MDFFFEQAFTKAKMSSQMRCSHAYPYQISPVRYVFSFRIFGDLKNYTFLETLGSTESEKQCLHFSKHPMAAILDFQNGDYFFPEIRQYLSF